MDKINKRKVLHLVTRYALFKRGYQIPDGYDIEWDPMEPDSQYSMLYEDVEHMIEGLEKYGYEIVVRDRPKSWSSATPTSSATAK